MHFDKQDSAGYLINHVARLFARELQLGIAPLGIVVGQFPILLELWQKDGVSQKQLLENIDVEQATLANTLNRMERDGLIKRTKSQKDARVQLIWLTDKAAVIREKAYEVALDVNARALKDIPQHELEIFMNVMRRVISRLRER
ncbi:winged helix-turn-helix transcriptional regulator [Tropicibacter sp. R16_0]|nr:MarR family winged helix-turn-helix transcriptional regulator [Tropicibacter sp. R16_0]MBO9448881.1 winged helix-turn-helix transcriptional regulator [Tropicibacter sp. R16_0]